MEFNTKIYGGHRGARYADLLFPYIQHILDRTQEEEDSPSLHGSSHSA